MATFQPAYSLTRVSKYGTIVQSVTDSICHGSFRPGDSLPSLRQQMQLHQVSLNTARRAYYELERLGYIQAHPRNYTPIFVP